MTTRKLSRRNALKAGAAAAAGVFAPTIAPSSVFGASAPSNRVQIGVIGCGSRSKVVLDYVRYEKSQIVAVADPIRERRLVRKQEAGGCDDTNDFRELLERDDVDAVHIATGDYWHVPISLAAARAGKDMYTEKPLGLSIEQDIAARDIVNKHDRIFQYGTQNRSMSQLRMGLQLVLNGHIGEVREVYVWCPPGESGGSPTPVLPVPAGYDYDLWLGPAPKAPFCKDRCLTQGPRNGIFHIYDYAIGFIAGWGAHPMDQLQWWADHAGLTVPVRYEGTGSIPSEGLFDTVTHWDVTCTYANGLRMRFVDGETARKEKKIPYLDDIKFGHGTLFVGESGKVAVSRGAWKVFPEELYETAKNPGPARLMESDNHTRNFVDSVLDRRQPISNLQSAAYSDIICHLSDICIRTGRPITWDPEKETIVGDGAAAERTSRPLRAPWTL